MNIHSVNDLAGKINSRRQVPRFNLNKYVFIGIGITFITLLVILPIASMFQYASSKGLEVFWENISSPEALFSLRFTVVLALATTVINGVMGTLVVSLSRENVRVNCSAILSVKVSVHH